MISSGQSELRSEAAPSTKGEGELKNMDEVKAKHNTNNSLGASDGG